MDLSHLKSLKPLESNFDESGIRRRVVRIPSHMENHIKCILLHTVHFKACKVEDNVRSTVRSM